MGGGDAPCGNAGKGRAARTLQAQPGPASLHPVRAPESESGGLWPLRLLHAPGGGGMQGVGGEVLCCRPTRDFELGMPIRESGQGPDRKTGASCSGEKKKSGMITIHAL